MPRRSFNPKRRLRASVDNAERRRLFTVNYTGNPEHKRNPGDFGLQPPAQPQPDSSLCDEIALFSREEALVLLHEGVRRGLVSEQVRGSFPQNIWSRTQNGRFVEAQLENSGSGAYHGYPMPENDPFVEILRDAWERSVRFDD